MKSTGHDYTITGSGTIAGSGGLVLGAANTRTLTLANGGNTFTGSTIIGGGTLRLSGNGRLGNGTYAGAISIADGATFENAGSATQTLSGAITGTGGTVKHSGNGQLILSNSGNSYGALSIGNGRVFISTNAGALPSAATVNITGGILVLAPAPAMPIQSRSAAAAASPRATSAGTGLTGAVTLPGSGTVIFNNDDASNPRPVHRQRPDPHRQPDVQIGGNRTNQPGRRRDLVRKTHWRGSPDRGEFRPGHQRSFRHRRVDAHRRQRLQRRDHPEPGHAHLGTAGTLGAATGR
jgi:autotransporter-associated beta strand protein